MNDLLKYGEAAQLSAERYSEKLLRDLNQNVPDAGQELLKLIKLIPNWDTYLTEKQYEVAKKYITCMNASEVDYQLNLTSGTTQQRLFGSSTSKGALGTLREKYKRLKENGYYEKQDKIRQQNGTNKQQASKLTGKTKEQIRELFRLIAEMPEYEIYLTKSQNERIYQFLRLRSIKLCAEHFNITETTFRQSLFGKNESDGILGKLKKASQDTTVNSWDDI